MGKIQYLATQTPIKNMKGFDNLKARNELLLTNPNYFHAIMKVDDPASPMSVLGVSLGGFYGTNDPNEGVTTEKTPIGSEYVKYLYYSEQASVYPSRVKSNSSVPDVIVAGENFQMGIDEQIYEVGAKLQLRDKTNELYIVGKQNSIGDTVYTFQLVGQAGYTISKELLALESPLTYSGNMYPEGSTTNHPVLLNNPRRIEESINLLSIMRHEAGATGSAESNDDYYMFRKIVDDKVMEQGMLNLPVKFLKEHLKKVNYQLTYSRANFDPLTKKVNNRTSQGQYHEVPSFSGIKEQLEAAKHQFSYDLKARSYANAIKFLEGILKYMSQIAGKTDMNLVAYATGAGRAWLSNVINEGGLKVSGVTLQQQIKGGETNVTFGYVADTYVSRYGKISIFDIADSHCYNKGAFDTVSYDGMQYDRESLDIYFFPDMVDKKKTVKLYYKSGEYNGKEVNRMLVLGHQKGMSGYGGNTLNDTQLSDAAIAAAMKNSNHDVASAFDGDLWMALSHMSVMVNTMNVARLRLQTPTNLVQI